MGPSMGPIRYNGYGQQAGVFTTTLSSNDVTAKTAQAYLSNRKGTTRGHMTEWHGEIMSHILLGGQINKSALISPSVPGPVGSILASHAHGLELDYARPPRLDHHPIADLLKARWAQPWPSVLQPKSPAELQNSLTAVRAVITGVPIRNAGQFPTYASAQESMVKHDFRLPTANAKHMIQHKNHRAVQVATVVTEAERTTSVPVGSQTPTAAVQNPAPYPEHGLWRRVYQ